MKFFLLIIIVLFSFNLLNSQEIETIQIKKNKSTLYRGINHELNIEHNQNIENWYFYMDNEFCYMANLHISENEVLDWFEKRKNSQNIFKGELINQQYQTIILMKENEPELRLNFYIEFQAKDTIKLTNIDDTRVYLFVKI
jgi:hypothetical protein